MRALWYVFPAILTIPFAAHAQTYEPGAPYDYTQQQNYLGPQRDQSDSFSRQQFDQSQRMQEMQDQQRYQQQQQENQFNAQQQQRYDQQQENYQRQNQINQSSCGFGRVC